MTRAVSIAQSGANNVTMRNRIINGAMMIDQRNAGASVTPTNAQYLVDRWGANLTQASKYSAQQSTTTPNGNFKNSLAVTVGASANVTVGAGDVFAIYQFFEGNNTYDFGWGTSSAVAVTVSFWVRASVTGTYVLQVQNYAQTYSYIATYTISTANTWQYVTVTIPAQTSGVWATDNTVSLMLRFVLGSGSTYSTGSPNSWQAGNYWTATGCTNIITTNSATFYITGVQLEAGTTATPFEQRLYGTELALCQRYYETSYSAGVAVGANDSNGRIILSGSSQASNLCLLTIQYKVSKRTNATATLYSQAGTAGVWDYERSGVNSTNTPVAYAPSTQGTNVYMNVGSAWVSCTTYGHFAVSAEL